MRYGIPLTDPRWLEATEEQIVEDMLVCMYHDARTRRADPNRKLAEDMAAHPEQFDAVDQKLRDALKPDGALGRLLQPRTTPASPIRSVRIGGRVVTGG